MKMLLDMSPRNLEKVLYFAAFVVTDPGNTPLQYKQVLSDKEYRDAQHEYGAKAFKRRHGRRGHKGAAARTLILRELARTQLSRTSVNSSARPEARKRH